MADRQPLNNRPPVGRFLISLSVTAVAVAIATAYSLISPLGMICHAHSTIARLHPLSSDPPVTLFSVLRLNYPEEPFYPPDKCAYPYHENYRAARQAIIDAWYEVTDKHNGYMLEWRDAFSAAAMVLLNDTTRIVYTKEVLPKIEAKGDRGWR
ncbi:hypothetical protein CEP54_014584 [Fusarium duplospermum]|uniref:Uncharacterized protein n=1 Tax=Fusarium duplospermum TaxID=1325734 RepID=A0A428NVC9_9HYPO|nr:hypothetical protein CEP54_014584 [Fusarium duplospermum]